MTCPEPTVQCHISAEVRGCYFLRYSAQVEHDMPVPLTAGMVLGRALFLRRFHHIHLRRISPRAGSSDNGEVKGVSVMPQTDICCWRSAVRSAVVLPEPGRQQSCAGLVPQQGAPKGGQGRRRLAENGNIACQETLFSGCVFSLYDRTC